MKPIEITQRAQDLLKAKSYRWFKDNVGMNNTEVRKALKEHSWDVLRAKVITRYHKMLIQS